jgi:hypothetical protein
MPPKIEIFISHSHADEKVAAAVSDLLQAALPLKTECIRCTSVDGHKLDPGAKVDDSLRDDIAASKMLVGLISEDSMASTHVLFELGAGWGLQKPFIPLLAPAAPSSLLKGPLLGINAPRCDLSADLHRLVEKVGK